jgi:hypothetical protein
VDLSDLNDAECRGRRERDQSHHSERDYEQAKSARPRASTNAPHGPPFVRGSLMSAVF